MTDDVLAREVELLCAQVEQVGHRNVRFVAERLQELLAAGHLLTDVETALRRRDAPIFLVGLPLTAEMETRFRLVHPDDAVDNEQLRFFLWIEINGRAEVDRVLAEASLTVSMNLANLATTGLLGVEHQEGDLPSDPTLGELLDWLLLDASTWTARRVVVGRYLDVLCTEEARHTLDGLGDRADLDPSFRSTFIALRELIRRASEDGPRLAFQTCEPLLDQALQAFLAARTWRQAGEVYALYEYELSGDLATEMLMRTTGQSRLTAAQREVIDAHVQVLESAWERGIEAAIAEAEQRFSAKHGTPAAEDHLLNYLAAPDLEAARDILRAAPKELFRLDHDALEEGMQRAGADDDLWRIGLFEDSRDRGIDEAFRDWAELRTIESSTDYDEAVELLTELLARHQRCLRDRALEVLTNFHIGAGDVQAQRPIAQELVDHRSAGSPPSRRPLDLVNLGLVCAQQGELQTARATFREALTMIVRLRERALRGLIWLRVGTFSRYYDEDLAMAVHSFRVAAEEFRAAGDLVSAAYAFEQLSSAYRWLYRVTLARVYAVLAQRSIADVDGNERGVAGDFSDVAHAVEKGIAETEFLSDEFPSAANRLKWLLTESSHRIDDDERVLLERVALACAIHNDDRQSARDIVTSWSAIGWDDWAAFGRVAIALGESAADDRDRTIEPAQLADLAGLADTLGRLGYRPPDVERLISQSTHPRFGWAVIDTLAGVSNGDPYLAGRLMGEYEALAWETRSERTTTMARTTTVERIGYTALPSEASWSEVIARYHDLGIWELPDLAILGPILDRWSLLSRFDDAIRINQPSPAEGCLDVYFFRSDPEGHLDRSVRGCAYIPEGELIVCSLPYLDGMFRIDDDTWEAEIKEMSERMQAWVHDAADIFANKVLRGRERILLEWVIAHEIGHAHFGHAATSSDADALALEEEADSFFLDGVLADDGLVEILGAMRGQLNRLYEYDCQKQFNRPLTPDELRDRSLMLDATPDASGHRPLVFRAVTLVRSILRMRPDLEDSRFMDEFAASLEGR